MNHYKLNIVYGDGSQSTYWIVDGKYKITCYDYRLSGGQTEKRKTWHAYYKPSFLKNWGNHVNRQTPDYDDLESALDAVYLFDQVSGDKATAGGHV